MTDLIKKIRNLAEAATDDIYTDAEECADRVELQHVRASEVLKLLKEKHQIHMLWGEAPDPQDPAEDTFTFDTKAELDAFLIGVAAMDGWGGYQTFNTREELDEAIAELKESA